MRFMQEEGKVDNAARDNGGGISMVHRCGLKNLLMVKSESFRNCKATNFKKEAAVPTTSMCRQFGQSHMWLVCTSFLPYPKYDVNRLILYGRYQGPLATAHRLVGLRLATLSEK